MRRRLTGSRRAQTGRELIYILGILAAATVVVLTFAAWVTPTMVAPVTGAAVAAEAGQ